MGERRLVNSAVLSSRLRRLTRPGSLKRRTPQKSQIQKNLNELIACDLVGIAKTLKKSTVSCLSLFQKHADLQKRIAENRKLGFLGYRHSEALFTFSRAVAWALSGSGWLQELELGFALWERDLRIIAESLGRSTTLKRLSFANSELGDHSLQILGKSLQECAQLEILNLSACALTDAIAPLLSAIIKAHVCRRAQADWQASLRSSKGVNALTIRPKGLIALDISLNHLTDITMQTICSVLRIGTPLEALNLRSNQLTRISGKLLLDVMEEWAILRFVDLRDNTDNRLMGVLEDGQHLTTFSQVQAPFWMTSPSIKLKRTRSKTSSKQPRALNGWEDAKPSVRPRSAPSSTLPTHLQAKGHYKPPLVPPQSTKRHVDYAKNSPRFCTTDDNKSDKKHTRRPSTCPTKDHYTTEKKQLSSSCSTSLEFAAWEYDDPNTKENRLPFQMSRANALGSGSGMLEGCMSDEELTWKESIQTKPLDKVKHKLPHVTRIRPEEVAVLRPVDMTKSGKFGENIDSINCQGPKFKPREGSKPGSRNPKCLKPQLENPDGTYDDENGGVYEESQQKNVLHKSGIRNLPSKTFSTSTIQTTEWNSFLKEITQAILHLQERLDELIGPADPDSLTEQATSQLQALFR